MQMVCAHGRVCLPFGFNKRVRKEADANDTFSQQLLRSAFPKSLLGESAFRTTKQECQNNPYERQPIGVFNQHFPLCSTVLSHDAYGN